MELWMIIGLFAWCLIGFGTWLYVILQARKLTVLDLLALPFMTALGGVTLLLVLAAYDIVIWRW